MTATTATDITFSLDLDDGQARDPARSGSKAASLATARGGGIRVIPGFVVSTATHAAYLDAGRRLPPDVAARLRPAWAAVSRNGSAPLVVRSSSTVEDVGASSMAGRFRSVLDVRGWDAFLEAVSAVFASGDEVGGPDGPSAMGVLVQPFLVPRCGGVMFGVDPVSGDANHVIVEAVPGGPDALVSGRVAAQHYVVSTRGRLLAVDHRPQHLFSVHRSRDRLLTDREVRALTTLAARARQTFGSPQDVEWAVDRDGNLLLLQSRPVTATGSASQATGPVLGPGPVAETFPDPLGPLETDLWVGPLHDGVVAALQEARAVPASRLGASPVVTTARGRVAADLELFGYVPHRRPWARLDPRPAVRRLGAAWRVGSLRAVLPQRAGQLVDEVDGYLASVRLPELDEAGLLAVLLECHGRLRSLHGEEVLAGTLLPPSTRTAAAAALELLAEHAEDVADDETLVHRHPLLLCLVPPAIGVPTTLPPAPAYVRETTEDEPDVGPRELIRLRARWVQELSARAAWSLGTRLASRGVLNDAASVALLDLDALRTAVVDGTAPADLQERKARTVADAFAPRLPAQFRLTRDGEIVPAAREGARSGSGVGAGGGRGTGPAVHGSLRQPPSPGDVLVVRELQPGLAAWLPGLAGLVAETGGTLSHLAILAREYGVPTVVCMHDALGRFPPGTRLLVDGTTGEVSRVDAEEES